MNSQKQPSFWSYLWISLVLFVTGWGGLIMLVFLTLPTLAPRWMFFFLLTLGFSGTALPVAYFLNLRFPVDPPVGSSIILREAMWFGVYGSLLAWLQMGRVLNFGLGVVLAVGLVLVEFLMRMSERSQWSPVKPAAAGAADDDPPDDEDEEEDD